MAIKHIMIPYRPAEVFLRAFRNGLNIAKQNRAKITVVKVINYPAGFGLDALMTVDAISREYEMYKFDKILPSLQQESLDAGVPLNVSVMDFCLSPAKAFVNFASKNKVDLMVIGSVMRRGVKGLVSVDISQEIMDLDPPCSVILVD